MTEKSKEDMEVAGVTVEAGEGSAVVTPVEWS